MIILTDEEVAKLRETLQYAIVIKAMARYAYEEALAALDAAPTVKFYGYDEYSEEGTPLYARTEVK